MVGTWQTRINPDAIAKALSITKPIPYTANGVWEATVQNVADALQLALDSDERNQFLGTAGVEQDRPTPDILDNLITESQYEPEGYN